eukprot:CFRG3308T1
MNGALSENKLGSGDVSSASSEMTDETAESITQRETLVHPRQISYSKPEFVAATFMGGPTRQTVLGTLIKRPHTRIKCNRVRYETDDDDFLDIDYFDCEDNPWVSLGENSPIILLVHGLGGSAQSGYVREMARQLASRGMRSAGMNCRGSSGEPNRQARLYFAGDIWDPGFVLDCVMKDHPKADVGICGFSLGASQTLNYMCHRAGSYPDRLKLAVAISPPLYLEKGMIAMETPAGMKWNSYLLNGLKKLIQPLFPVLKEKSTIDIDAVMASTTIREFDATFTCPLHGYSGIDEYYSKCSAGPLLHKIKKSTLVIRSGDDPFLAPEDVECPALRTNPHITALLTNQGGHVGFVEREGMQLLPWAERVGADWCAAMFGLLPEPDEPEM